MNTLYNLREWIYECERFLFLAEVHFHKEDVVPSHHRFACEMNGALLEAMLDRAEEMYRNYPHRLSFTSCLSSQEMDLLKRTLDGICREDWGSMCLESVLESQRILHRLGQAVDRDIMQTYESKGYPSFYKLCGVRYA
ncbi:MAG: hypothetical protein PWP14_1724 [Methanolobus sp.]|jgi:hypothetical protein|nr:hypothetical protein [Methanolobus sp.]MDN5310330.1 hypothetical protein [Methanolobus sp.]